MTMLAVLGLLLMLRLSRCTDEEKIEIKTVRVGDEVKLTCPRKTSASGSAKLFWFKQVSGELPEILGGTLSFDFDDVTKTPHTTLKQEPGTFVLIINQTQLSDTGLYFCVRQEELKVTLLKGVFLRTKGPESDITTIIQDLSADPDHPDLMTLQCSVFSDSETKTCPGNHNVFWFRSGSDEAHPSVIYTHGNRRDECEESPETQSPQKCVYSFSKTISSSVAGTYNCAVATCGQMLFGHGTEINMDEHERSSEFFALVTAVVCVVIFVIGSFVFICCRTPRDKNEQSKAAVALQDGQRSQQEEEETWQYSTVVFTMRQSDFGPGSDITTIIQDLSADPDHPDLMTLQCSVFSDSETKTCPGNHSVFWFRSGSDEAHPSVIYTHGNRCDECEESPETQSPQKCVYSFSKTVSSSDVGTYYCAVATCGQMLFGHGTEINIEGSRGHPRTELAFFISLSSLFLSASVMLLPQQTTP
ncbi:uncharacterized protein LOC121516143 [Cheilinus undulatus]|uniref:uncharacterized protein LOC121516143 n=1 Tax=Cheilinus undulatus TaxID=241271 RepID=UPI001BD2C91E|nr:uncharacterized protein LOC121516143 [Cheilinus undulatus]